MVKNQWGSSESLQRQAMEYEQTKAASTVLEPEVVELVHYFKIGDRLGGWVAGWLELGVMLMDDISHSHDVAVRMRKTCMSLVWGQDRWLLPCRHARMLNEQLKRRNNTYEEDWLVKKPLEVAENLIKVGYFDPTLQFWRFPGKKLFVIPLLQSFWIKARWDSGFSK